MEDRNNIPYYGPIYEDGFLRIEYENYFVSVAGERIDLPRTQFLILCRLSRNPGRVVAYSELWCSVWGDRKPLKYQSLRVAVFQLRRLIEPHGANIENLMNVGYRLVLPKNRGRAVEHT